MTGKHLASANEPTFRMSKRDDIASTRPSLSVSTTWNVRVSVMRLLRHVETLRVIWVGYGLLLDDCRSSVPYMSKR